MAKYVIGIDYGTLSARALLLHADDGKEIAISEFVYPHAVMSEKDISGKPEKPTTALQHPQDYLDALSFTVKDVLKKSGVSANDVCGIGIDFTSCTVLPTDINGVPLCFYDRFKEKENAYVKLWKHHGANDQAERMTEIAKQTKQGWLEDYGGKVSSEWLFPKLFETAECSPTVYDSTALFLEAGDWLTYILTGNLVRSSCMAGFKALWSADGGYPSQDYLEKVNPIFKTALQKVKGRVLPVCEKAGELNDKGALLTGLNNGTVVAVPVIDAHVALPSAGVTDDGGLLIIMGTSACHIVLSEKDKKIKGICGKVKDGVAKGYFAYEAGQAGFGDILDWFINNWVTQEYFEQAKNQGVNIFDYLNQKASLLAMGKNSVLVLDWWNGNRTPYADYSLSGAVFGLNLKTKPEEIYYAIITALAYGTKRIIQTYENSGVAVNTVTASGGIAVKNHFFMQVFADVLGKEISVVDSKQAGAKGSAIYASVASGLFPSLKESAKVLGDKCYKKVVPNLENTKLYDKQYDRYVEISEFFASKKLQ
ncbi:MAG: ribulokinase [Clostridia bacterium]|nr:ribulokinase [Clostridia bacterium]